MVSLHEAVFKNLLGTSPPDFVSRLLLQLSCILLNVRPTRLTSRVAASPAGWYLGERNLSWKEDTPTGDEDAGHTTGKDTVQTALENPKLPKPR